jgi:hypothetical protein
LYALLTFDPKQAERNTFLRKLIILLAMVCVGSEQSEQSTVSSLLLGVGVSKTKYQGVKRYMFDLRNRVIYNIKS